MCQGIGMGSTTMDRPSGMAWSAGRRIHSWAGGSWAGARRDGGGMRVQAPPGVFFRISPSHFFLYMRVKLAVYRIGHEITGRCEIGSCGEGRKSGVCVSQHVTR